MQRSIAVEIPHRGYRIEIGPGRHRGEWLRRRAAAMRDVLHEPANRRIATHATVIGIALASAAAGLVQSI